MSARYQRTRGGRHGRDIPHGRERRGLAPHRRVDKGDGQAFSGLEGSLAIPLSEILHAPA
jgi:hypothetical protein